MPSLGRRANAVFLNSGECLALIAEAASYSIPSFSIRLDSSSKNQYCIQQDIIPLGTRVAYTISDLSPKSVPVPVLYCEKSSSQSYQPFKTHILKDIVNPSIAYNRVEKSVHLFWWWNIWSAQPPSPPLPPVVLSPPPLYPSGSFSSPPLPPPPGSPPPPPPPLQPPNDYYESHSVPDPLTPAWLQSVVPKMLTPKCDPQRPFWVAPIPEGYRYDYWTGMTGGESKVKGDQRISLTTGAMLVQDMISRHLMDYPSPSQDDPKREDWELRGGIVNAGAHIRLASERDKPPFVPKQEKNPFTGELEIFELPGADNGLHENTTWEDHLVIVNALKAHFDYANLGNATRVLMYAKGFYLDGCILKTIGKSMTVQPDPDLHFFSSGPIWPKKSEEVTTSVLILDYPKVVGVYPCPTNYRTTINADRVWYPPLDYGDVGVNFVMDGFLIDCATSWVHQLSALDWVLSDPSEAAAEAFGAYDEHLDLLSF